METRPVKSRLLKLSAEPTVLLILIVLSYGLLTPWLGYYWDDWLLGWISHSLGPQGLRDYTFFTRPAQGWLHSLTTPLLGNVPFHWHVFALFTRWGTAMAAWWCLLGLWPERRWEVAGISFLFAVYPGFTQQPIAMSYGSDFIHLIAFLLSLGCTVWALRSRRLFWPLSALAIVSLAVSLMLTEYYVGLELVRPLMIAILLSEKVSDSRSLLRRTIANWSPYLVCLVGFVCWRLFIFKSAAGYLNQSSYLNSFAVSPFSELFRRIQFAFGDVIESGLMAWGQAFRPDLVEFESYSVWLAWGLACLSGAGVGAYLLRRSARDTSLNSDTPDARLRWGRRAVVVGLFSMFVGGLPIWFIDRDVRLGGFSDRFTLPLMLGACIFLVGLTKLLVRTRVQQIIAVSLIVGFSVGFHFRNANRYRHDWTAQKSLFWQLSWRVPGLKPGTSIIIDDESILMPSEDYALAAPLNLIYALNHSSPQLDYWFLNLSARSAKYLSLKENVPVNRTLGNISFSGSTSDILVVWFSPGGCLRVLDPGDELPGLPPLARAAQTISHLDRIVTAPESPARPPEGIFGPEPENCWCYYFEKADLARQVGDWQGVAALGDEARRRGFRPDDASEWLPFIEGYSRVGRDQDAREMSEEAVRSMPAIETPLSLLWKRLGDCGSPNEKAVANLATR